MCYPYVQMYYVVVALGCHAWRVVLIWERNDHDHDLRLRIYVRHSVAFGFGRKEQASKETKGGQPTMRD